MTKENNTENEGFSQNHEFTGRSEQEALKESSSTESLQIKITEVTQDDYLEIYEMDFRDVNNKPEGRKYNYSVPIDPDDGDRATGFRIMSFDRPHMRAFWGTNIAHRATVFMWFSAVPLYPEIMASLGLTKNEIWTSALWALLGALISRLVIGFICERYGARIPLAVLTIFASIPTALQGAAQNANQLFIARFFVGIGGGSFVASNFWLNCMFKKELAASISGFSNGLGIAMGACQVFILYVVFPSLVFLTGSEEIAWRASFAVISLGALCVGIPLAFLTDDTPKGNYAKLKRTGDINPLSHWRNFYDSISHLSVFILSIQHALNLGIELVINNALLLYAMEQFGLNILMAGLVAATFPICSQFARVLGGGLMDKAYKEHGMRGQLQCNLIFLAIAGILFVVYSTITNLYASLIVLCSLSFFVFFSQSATFGLVPHICPDSNGVVSGIVSAAGTSGGIILGLLFRDHPYRDAFHSTGILFILSSFLTIFLVPNDSDVLANEKDTIKRKKTSDIESNSSCETEEESSVIAVMAKHLES